MMLFNAVHRDAAGALREGLTREEAAAALRAGTGLLWIDLEDPGEPERVYMTRELGLHPVPVDACISPEVHTPTANDYEGYLFLNVHGINYAATADLVSTTELSLFVGPGYVVSSHNVPLFAVSSVRRSTGEDTPGFAWSSAGLLAHALVDTLVANVQPTVDKMEEGADQLEEQALRQPHQHLVEGILALRRSASGLHRVMASQQTTLSRLVRGDSAYVPPQAFPYFRDTQEQLWRIAEYCQTLRERADSALATYMSSVAFRQNESMRVLTMVAAIFLPLSLVTGVFGMNFDNMPQLHLPWGYYAVVGSMSVVVGVMSWVFWVRGWLRRRLARQLRWVRPFAVEMERLVTMPRDLLRSSTEVHARVYPHARRRQSDDDERDD